MPSPPRFVWVRTPTVFHPRDRSRPTAPLGSDGHFLDPLTSARREPSVAKGTPAPSLLRTRGLPVLSPRSPLPSTSLPLEHGGPRRGSWRTRGGSTWRSPAPAATSPLSATPPRPGPPPTLTPFPNLPPLVLFYAPPPAFICKLRLTQRSKRNPMPPPHAPGPLVRWAGGISLRPPPPAKAPRSGGGGRLVYSLSHPHQVCSQSDRMPGAHLCPGTQTHGPVDGFVCVPRLSVQTNGPLPPPGTGQVPFPHTLIAPGQAMGSGGCPPPPRGSPGRWFGVRVQGEGQGPPPTRRPESGAGPRSGRIPSSGGSLSTSGSTGASLPSDLPPATPKAGHSVCRPLLHPFGRVPSVCYSDLHPLQGRPLPRATTPCAALTPGADPLAFRWCRGNEGWGHGGDRGPKHATLSITFPFSYPWFGRMFPSSLTLGGRSIPVPTPRPDPATPFPLKYAQHSPPLHDH